MLHKRKVYCKELEEPKLLLSKETREKLYAYVQNKYYLFRKATDENKTLPMGQYSEAYTEYLKLDCFKLYEVGRASIIGEFRFLDKDSYHNDSGVDLLSTTIHIEIGTNNCYFFKQFDIQMEEVAKSKELYIGYIEQYMVDIIQCSKGVATELLNLAKSIE